MWHLCTLLYCTNDQCICGISQFGLSQPHTEQVHLELARLNTKVPGVWGASHALTSLAVVNKWNTLLENNSNAVIELFKCLKQTTREREERTGQSGGSLQPLRLMSLFTSTFVQSPAFTSIHSKNIKATPRQVSLPETQHRSPL